MPLKCQSSRLSPRPALHQHRAILTQIQSRPPALTDIGTWSRSVWNKSNTCLAPWALRPKTSYTRDNLLSFHPLNLPFPSDTRSRRMWHCVMVYHTYSVTDCRRCRKHYLWTFNPFALLYRQLIYYNVRMLFITITSFFTHLLSLHSA